MPEDPATAGLVAISEALKAAEQLQAEKNTPEMIKAKEEQNVINKKDQIIKDVTEENVAATQEDIAD